MASSSGVNGIVRPVSTTYVGVNNVVRAANRSYVGVANAVRPVNRTYVGVYAPFTEVRIVLNSISIQTINTSSGDTTGYVTPATLANARNYATLTIDEANRILAVKADHSGYGVMLGFTVYAVSGNQVLLQSALSSVESFSMVVPYQAWYGGSQAEGWCSGLLLGYQFHPDGWRNSFYENKTFTKETVTSSSGQIFNALKYGGYTVEQMTFPATAKVNGLDIPVTLVNQLS